MKLAENEISLWLQPIKSEEIIQPERVLNEKEMIRYHRFQLPAKRAELLSSRLLLYKILHYYLPDKTEYIETVIDDLGRPFWFSQGKKLPLYFSLSHTKELLACAIACIPDIGCDLEKVAPRKYEKELARKVFGKKEYQHFKLQTDETTARRFFYQSWTLKEAYLKAIGTGLRSSLTQLDFTHKIASTHFTPIRPHAKENANVWYFHHQFLPQNFSLSLATKIKDPIIYSMISSRSLFDRNPIK